MMSAATVCRSIKFAAQPPENPRKICGFCGLYGTFPLCYTLVAQKRKEMLHPMAVKQRRLEPRMVEMTSGSLWKNIFLFSIPLMFSQILEVLFNLSDVAIAGKFAGYAALGSVGSTTILVSLFTGFLLGLGGGINVRTAHELGVGDRQAISETVHASLLISLVMGLVVCLACLFFAGPMLSLLDTKDELMDGAVTYLKIYALGMPAMGVYNCGNGILSACGDTRRPLYYLTAAGILNVILNLFFVIVCGMAAAGVAVASVIAQYLSALLILRNLLRREDDCRLHPGKLRFYPQASRAVLLIGIPTGIQNALFAIANLFVQVGVNSFSAVGVSGNAAAANADSLIYNVMAAFHTACASFVSRNLGAGNRDRMMKSYLISVTYSFLSGALLGGALLVFGRQFLSIFASEPQVIDAGMERIRILGWCYCVSAFMDCTIAASRGLGKSIPPTAIVIMGSCVFRIIWVYTVFAYFKTIASLYLLYIFSWTITAAAEIVYFLVSYRKIMKAPLHTA